MESRVEKFIAENRSSFDDREPSGRVWRRIENLFFGKTKFLNAVRLWRTAAMLFMALSVYLFIHRFSDDRERQAALSEFQDVEIFYSNQISSKLELIESQGEPEEGVNGFTHDFHQLEAMYQVLKEEFNSRPTERVKDALVLNLLVRIDLLNQQLYKMDKRKVVKEEHKITV